MPTEPSLARDVCDARAPRIRYARRADDCAIDYYWRGADGNYRLNVDGHALPVPSLMLIAFHADTERSD